MAAGKKWEADSREGFRANGLDTEHHRDTGTKDQGDLAIRVGKYHFVAEVKNAKLNVTDFLRQATEEARNYAEARSSYLDPDRVFCFVNWKRRGMSFMGGVVMLDMETWLRILKELEGK